MTMPAWYMDMWVNAPLPVMSPSAHTPGAARMWLVHRDGPQALVDAHRAGADPGEVGAPAGGHQQRVTGEVLPAVQGDGEASGAGPGDGRSGGGRSAP